MAPARGCGHTGAGANLWWALYALVVAAGMYTLYLTALTWLIHAILLAVRSWPNRKRHGAKAWRWLLVYGGAIVLYLPWMPRFFGQLDHPSLPGLNTKMNLSTMGDLIGALFVGVDASHTSTIETWAIIVVLVLLGALTAGIMRQKSAYGLAMLGESTLPTGGRKIMVARKLSGGQQEAATTGKRLAGLEPDARAVLLAGVLGLGPVLLIVLYTALAEWVRGGFFMIHYIVPFAPFEAMFLAVIISSYQCDEHCASVLRMRTVAWSLALILSLVGVSHLATTGNYNFEQRYVPSNNKVAAAVTCSPDNPVVAAQDYAYIDMYFYFRGCGDGGYLLSQSNAVEYRGGYAPIADMNVQVDSLAKLTVDRFTLVSADTDSEHLSQSKGYAITGTPHKVGNKLIATYQRTEHQRAEARQ